MSSQRVVDLKQAIQTRHERTYGQVTIHNEEFVAGTDSVTRIWYAMSEDDGSFNVSQAGSPMLTNTCTRGCIVSKTGRSLHHQGKEPHLDTRDTTSSTAHRVRRSS